MQNKCKPVVGLTGIILALGLMAPSGVQASALATPGPATSQARYLAGVRQAVSDFQHGVNQAPSDPVMAAGYQQGMQRARQWQASQPTPVKPDQPTPATPGPGENAPTAPSSGAAAATPAPAEAEADPPQEPSPDQAAFLKLVGPAAVTVAAKFDLYPSVMLAQAILESNWGQSDLSRIHHNLFGIKGAFDTQSVALPTTEHLNGHDQGLVANFRAYPDLTASLADYAAVLAQPCYKGVHRSQAKNWQGAVQVLAGTYATDPAYAQKLGHLIRTYHLDRFDHQTPLKAAQIQPTKAAGRVRMGTGKAPTHQPARPAAPASWHWSLPVAGGAGIVGLVDLSRRLLH